MFSEFLDELKELPAYEKIRIMFYHLFTENFFRFSVKNKALALDFGTPENDFDSQMDSNQGTIFWNEIRKDLKTLENSDVVDLIQLNALREKAIEPFANMLPEKALLTEALNEFEAIKLAVQEPVQSAPLKVSRKQVSESCRAFLKTSETGSMVQNIEIEEVEWNEDAEFVTTSKRRSKVRGRKRAANPKETKEQDQDSSSSDSSSEKDFKRMNRTMGFSSQNVMYGIGAAKHFSEKLKNCYGKLE